MTVDLSIYLPGFDPVKAKQLLQKLKKQGAAITASRGMGGHCIVRLHGYKTIVKFMAIASSAVFIASWFAGS